MNEIGIISEVRGDKARVAIGSLVTDFLPVFQPFSNSFAVGFCPIRVGEQVLVLPIRGSINSGVILRGLYQEKHKTEATDKKIHMTFEDGTKIGYSTETSTLEISTPKNINVFCDSANITAKQTTVKSPSIKLLGNTLIQGAIATAGKNGESGIFEIKGNVKITGSISASGDASFGGSVSDAKGDLTNHTNSGYSRD